MMEPQANWIDELGALVNRSVTDVFFSQFEMNVVPAPPPDLRECHEDLIVGSVGFVGAVHGVVYLQLTTRFASQLTARMLQMPEPELDDDMVNDAIAEVSNMVVGAVKSNLCDRGDTCVLTIPSIVRGRGLSAVAAGASQRGTLGFQCKDGPLLVEMLTRASA